MSAKEIWKDVVGYEGIYQISNLGRVKSLPRNNCNVCLKERILKQGKDHRGYPQVVLFKNSKGKNIKVHRLVARSFIPNPLNLPQVNHIDGNKQNNCVDNLEWCNQSYNMKEAYKLGLKKSINKGKFDSKSPNHKPIGQYDLNGNLIRVWDSCAQINRELGYYNYAISNCCNKKKNFKTAHGYRWSFIKTS